MGHGSRVAHMRLFKFVLDISWTYLGQNAGSDKVLASRSPKPYLLTEGQSVQYGRTGLSAHTYLYIQLSSFT